MSKIIASAAIRGSHVIFEEAEKMFKRAREEKSEDTKVEFPETAFFFPMANALMGVEVKTVGEIKPVLEHARSLLAQEPSLDVWLPYLGDTLDAGIVTLLSEEIITGVRYLFGEEPQEDCNGFFTDTILRTLGIQLVDGRMPGFAAILGAAPTNQIGRPAERMSWKNPRPPALGRRSPRGAGANSRAKATSATTDTPTLTQTLARQPWLALSADRIFSESTVPSGTPVLKMPMAVPASLPENHWEIICGEMTASAIAPIPEITLPTARAASESPEANRTEPAVISARAIRTIAFWLYRSASIPAGMDMAMPGRAK